MRFSLTFAAFLTACSTPRPAPLSAATPTPTAIVAPAVLAKPTSQRLMAGGWPGSNSHRWGTRFYELRRVPTGASGAALELRLHDEIRFQGVGMRPEQMPPTQHACSTWEPLPAAIRVPPSAASCGDAQTECAAIDRHLHATAHDSTTEDRDLAMAMPDFMFGRGQTSCE